MTMTDLFALLIRAREAWRQRDERGDVPGWVLVTVMTAGLVMAIWGLADDQLQQMLSKALDSVKG
jgi:hypothetical protein